MASTKSISLSGPEIQEELRNLPSWMLSADGRAISKQLTFSDFASALEFVNRLGALADEANHHPDLTLGWGYVGITYTTHDVGGLRANDFAMARKTDTLKV